MVWTPISSVERALRDLDLHWRTPRVTAITETPVEPVHTRRANPAAYRVDRSASGSLIEDRRRGKSLSQSFMQRAVYGGALVLISLGACKDKTEETTQPSIVTGTIGVSLSAGALTVVQGQSGTVTVNTTRSRYAGAIELAAEGAPNGVMVAFAPASLADGATTSVLTIAVSSSASPGLTNITIKARGAEVAEQQTTLALTISPPPTIAIVTPSAGVSVSQGITDFTPVTITRNQYTAPVTLSVSGLPSGVFATVADAVVAGSVTSVSISATAAASAGTSTVTISAQGTGVATATATFPLTVSVPTGTQVPFRFCGTPAGASGSTVPVWAAAQNGTNPWRQLTREAGERYNPSFGSQGGIVTVVQTGADRFSVRVRYGSLAELQALAARTCTDGGTKPHTGTVAGLAAGEIASVAMGLSTALATAPATSFALSNLADNAMDFVAVKRSAAANPLKLIVRRGLTLPFNSVLDIDFAASEAFDPILKQAGATNLTSGELLTVLSQFRTGNGTEIMIGSRNASAGASTSNYDAVPSASLGAGDVQALTILAGTQSGGSGTARYVRYDYRDAIDRQTTFGALIEAPTITATSPQPNLRMRASGNRSGDYAGAYSVVFNQIQGTAVREASVEATTSYLGGGSTYGLEMPDFNQVAGWKAAFGLQGTSAVNWIVSASDWTGAPRGFVPAFVDGLQLKASERTGSTTP